jgi:signal transduction histidine kinase
MDGRRDASQTAWEFTVQPAYYQTIWFYALCICIAAATIWWAWRLRMAFIHQQFSLALAERARLGRELHDTLLQSLVGVTLQLGAVANAVGSDRFWIGDQLTRIRRHVEAYIEEAEQSIRDLRSPSLVKKDLVTALNEFGAETVAPYAIRFEPATTSPLPRCSAKVEAQLLRIGQEAITNAVRHAMAGRISLDVRSDGHLVTLRVSDNGCGFDAEHPPADTRHHFGLLTMKERAEELGGRLAIVSSPTGTTVEAVVPLSMRDRVLVEA